MTSRLSAPLSLVGSIALHGFVFGVVVSSASGAEPAPEDPAPAARFSGDTFEIETLEAPGQPQSDTAGPATPLTPSEALPAAAPEPTPADARATAAEPMPVVLGEAAEAPRSESLSPKSEPAPSAARQAGIEAPRVEASPPAATAAAAAGPADAAANVSDHDLAVDAGRTAPTSPSAGQAWGEAAPPSNLASLAKGFTRAVPRAAFPDPVWHHLPLGDAGKIVFSIQLDTLGKVVGGLESVELDPAPPDYLKRLATKTLLLLKAGQFALGTHGIRAGTQRFELSASIRQVPALDDVFAQPQDLRQIGRFVEPSPTRPGQAHFTYNSGRQVELRIRMLAD